jgi:subtilisin-like proprotein convertase family protein
MNNKSKTTIIMRKTLLLIISFFCAFVTTMAQNNEAEKNAALQLVSANRAVLGLSADDLNNLTVSASYVDKTIGVRYAYLQQTYRDIPVYNQIHVLAFKNNKLAIASGGRIAEFDKKVNVPSGIPMVSAESAVMSALTNKGLSTFENAVAIKTTDNGRKVEFGKLGVSRENITAQLMWSPMEDGTYRLAWQVYFIPTTTPDAWMLRVDAVNNTIIGTDNLTVSCNWNDPNHIYQFGINHNHVAEATKTGTNNLFDFRTVTQLSESLNGPTTVANASYRVVPLPYEAPTFMPGAFPGTAPGNSTVVNNPWTAASANATTLNWHSDAAATDYNYTRGNNNWAYFDIPNTNTPDAVRASTSTTPLPTLTFIYGNAPDYNLDPVTNADNQKFNVTNLFYYNNIIHDVLYAYGFDEPGGNFQANNLGRGGNGNDYVFAEAQDAGGTNNANFFTPADGQNPRMQMYIWTQTAVRRDGDVDNGIIAHEFGHGLSNRLFGGPLNVNCVSNGEHQGEGISDWNALMLTQIWSASNVNSGLVGRGIGTFALGQATTGIGIRSQRYSTDMAINNKVYQAVLPAAVHDRGEFWCAAAWEATWAIIQQSGTVAPDVYFNGTSTAGNHVAFRIGVQAMKLAPCGSGFIDHRDGWLKADTLLYGGTYSCAIWRAFAKRGMGFFASQGSPNSANDQVPDFTPKSQVTIAASAPTVPDGQNLTYTNTVSTCSGVAIAGYSLQSTLPLNVTFVSATNGGVYNVATRVITWPVNQAATSSVIYQFTVTVGPGAFPGNVVMPACLYDNSATPRLFNCATVTTPITPILAGCPTVGTQPTGTTVCVNTTATFSMTATALDPIVYQWQVSTAGPGGPWANLTNAAPYSGVNTNTLTVNPAAAGLNGNYYRCFMTTINCPLGISTNPALLSVVVASIGGTITPLNPSVCGTPNTGTLTLSGHTGNIVRWESATVLAGPYTPIANTTTTLTFNNITQTTYYRAVVQVTGCAAVTSATATVTFIPSSAITITSDVGTTLCQGDPALLTAVVGPTLTTFTYNTPIVIQDATTANPYPANLTVSGLPVAGITVQSVSINGISHTFPDDIDILLQSPTGVNVVLISDVNGGNDWVNNNFVLQDGAPLMADATLNASGTYAPTNFVTPDTWVAPGPGSITQATPLLSTFTGNQNGVWKLFVVDDLGGDVGTINSWSITFSQPGGPIVGGTFLWTPATGLNSTTINPVAASPAVTTTYTVTHNNGSGCIRQASITLTVNQRPVVTAHPSNTTVCSGLPATFTAAGTGTGLTYQWQVSTAGAGGPYVDLANVAPYAGVNTATLTINPTSVALTGYYYRCRLSGTCAPFNPPTNITNGALLTVNGLPTVTVTPTGPVCGGVAGINGTALTASGANTYVWSPVTGLYTNATATTVYTGTNLATVYAAPTALTTYVVTGTATSTGCSNTASVIVNYTPPAPTVTPSSVTMCLGDPAVKLKSSSSQQFTASFTSGTLNTTIPDGPTIPPVPTSYPAVVSNITASGIPAGATIANVRVKFNITHAYVSDLVIALKAPNGSIINLCALANYANPAGANFVNTTFSSASGTAITPPYTGTYRADLAGATFNALGFTWPGGPTGYVPTSTVWSSLYSTPNGVWSVGLYDAGAPDGGVWNNWSLDIDYIVGVPATPAVWTPAAGLFSDANATTAYVAGTEVDSVWTKPTPSGVYNYQATVKSLNPSGTISLPAQATTFTGNVRGYWFTAPSSFTMSSLFVPTDASTGNQNIAVVRFNGATPPPAFPGTTNAFTTLFLTQNNPVGTPIPVNITINAGDVIGILGNRNNINSYGPAGPATTTINGVPVTLTRMGMQFPLATTAPQAIWQEPAGAISRVFFSYGLPVPSCTSPARNITVTVNQPLTVTTQPAAQSICTDKVATFSVAVSGTGPYTYQWQVSTDGGNTYGNVANGGVYSGATSATLTITAPPVTMSGYIYRCNITGAAPCPAITSFFRILTVYPLPTIAISANPTSLLPGMRTTINSTVAPNAANPNGGYQWLRNGVALASTSTGVITGIGTGALTIDVDGQGDYQLRVTDVNNCTNLSNVLTIKDSVSGRCFIYPNPSSGKFQVRYYSAPNNVLPRAVSVFDSKGERVLTQKYIVGRPYDRMDVDLRKYGKGLYWVEIMDDNGARLTMCRVVIQ